MKALLLTKTSIKNPQFEIREVETPLPKENEVQIKISHFGINFADVMAGRGSYRGTPPLPAIIGYESIGIISAVGNNTDSNLIGKKVLAFTRFGSYAEYVCTRSDAVIPIPENINETDALALATQYSTAWYACAEMIHLSKGDNVLIHSAAGGVGTALTQICKWKGCHVIGLTGNDEKVEYIKNNGADLVINYKKKNYAEEIKKQYPNGIQATFNAVAGSTFKKDKSILGVGGRIILFGAAERTNSTFGFFADLKLLFQVGFFSPLFLMMKTQGIIGFNMLEVADKEPLVLKRCLENVSQLTKEGVLKPHTSKIFNSNELLAAHQYLLNGKNVGKVGVKW